VEGIYLELYKLAKPYLDTRNNDIHTRLAFSCAKELLRYYPDANESVVLTAVLLHDVGWKMIPEDQHLKAFGPKMKDENLRRLHEVEGVRIASEIMNELGYELSKCKEVLLIIDGHDSREKALSLNDKLLKDADKLWRFTQTSVEIYHQRFVMGLQEYLDWLGNQITDWFFTPEADKIARETLAETRKNLIYPV
jgi:HD superfamily phosphohydrolase YqeK|tara:strand:+ start:2668 stop:3249 length:582 start_codon:yes stop_codon:yes gene_type:complete